MTLEEAPLNLCRLAQLSAEAAASTPRPAVADLALRHPSRAIIVLGDRRRDGVLASLQLHCHVPRSDGAQPVLYEQILARVRGDFDERVASVVIPLLVPDLPVFLWWTETPPSDGRHVDDLVTLADRLIVDSADFARADLTLPEVARLARFRVGITDLNWARLTDWRELIAQFFDVPAWRPFLNGITGIRAGFAVDMDGRDIHPSQALLLLGWLASRLAWRPVERLAPSEAGGSPVSPKSETLAWPLPPNRMFEGLRSRCTIPCECAWSRAAHASTPIRATCAGGRRRSASRRCLSVPPSRCSITR